MAFFEERPKQEKEESAEEGSESVIRRTGPDGTIVTFRNKKEMREWVAQLLEEQP